jgi:hypothetical protein
MCNGLGSEDEYIVMIIILPQFQDNPNSTTLFIFQIRRAQLDTSRVKHGQTSLDGEKQHPRTDLST